MSRAIHTVIKPITVALNGKGPATLFKRIWSISQRYGLTAAKIDHSLEKLSDLLTRYDCRATLPITAVALARNSAVIQKYQTQGIEFAVHGYVHIDHSHLPAAEQEVHLQQARQIFHQSGIHFEGFRCPYLRWNEGTLLALRQTNFVYDSSNSLFWDVPSTHTTDSYHRALEFYGAQPLADYLALPYLDDAHNLVRIPYCLPDDRSLIERLNWASAAEMDQVWPAMFRQLHQQGELFTLGLHPERTYACANGLAAALQEVHATGPAVWPATLKEIAAWWKARSEAVVQITALKDDHFQLTINSPDGATLLLRSLEVKTEAEPWFDGYQRATQTPCVIQTSKRPFIGLSPESDPALQHFLKQQGYIVETTSDPNDYSIYLDDKSFSRSQERSLSAKIEAASFPLVRLGRWPNGARSAFNVTGDIDAITFWDYGQRLRGK